jgi:hypothetical protein
LRLPLSHLPRNLKRFPQPEDGRRIKGKGTNVGVCVFPLLRLRHEARPESPSQGHKSTQS